MSIKGINRVRVTVDGMKTRKAPAVSVPKLKGATSPKKQKDTRIYKKSVLMQDPTEFNAVGFGNTGLTGED